MKIQLIRNGTLRIEYARKTILVDPYLADKHAHPSCAGISRNPMVDLPFPAEQVVAGIDLVVISHLHSDHYDSTARRLLPKNIKILCQPGDNQTLESHGFLNVSPVLDQLAWQGIQITRTPGQHGSGSVLDEMGGVSGFIFEAENELALYWAGDTVLCDPVLETIKKTQPDIIVTNSGGAVWGENVPIIMDAPQTIAVCRAAPNSKIVAVHLESEDHAPVTRADLRAYAEENGIPAERLIIPRDGEVVAF